MQQQALSASSLGPARQANPALNQTLRQHSASPDCSSGLLRILGERPALPLAALRKCW